MATPATQGRKLEQEAAERLMQAASGYMVSAALGTATKLNIAGLLANGPRPVAELAAETGSNEDALYRVLRALAAFGIFAEPEPRQFALTPASELLRPEHPSQTREIVAWISNPFHLQVWGDMAWSVKTGQPAVDHLFGKPCFDCFADMPDVAADFNAAMTAFSAQFAPALIEAYDFSGIETLMDVAGGHGYILCEVLSRYPRMKGILLDMPEVVEGAKPRLAELKLQNRCRTVAGNFFEEIPSGADAYYMQHIIHDWADDKALAILRNVARALHGNRNGRLLIADAVLPEKAAPAFSFLLDLEMLLMPGGHERTESQFRELLGEAGFEIRRIVPVERQSVIEARLKR